MNKLLNVFLFTLFSITLTAQSIDKVEAVIGDEIILTSDIESQYLQYLAQGNIKSEEIRCQIMEDLLFQKLLVHQAKIDSLEVAVEEVEEEVLKRLSYFESQLGSMEKVEEYFGKNKVALKQDLMDVIKDQRLAQKKQMSIVSGIKVTPAEVKDFLNSLNKEDIPTIPTQVELAQIIVKPEMSSEEKDKIREKLNDFRERVYKGEDFKVLATLYSDDPGSAAKGGELGFVNRGDLVPEFERAAFRLKEGEISEVVSSQFGFHIVQLIERRGEQINVRHILLKAKVNATALHKAELKIDSIAAAISSGEISFDDAVLKYSDDDSKNNGGLLLNPATGATLHTIDDMEPSLRLIVQKEEEKGISTPSLFNMQDGSKAFRILRVNKKREEHKANLVDDFSIIKDQSINAKKQKEIEKWINSTTERTYINISETISSCMLTNKWVK